MSTDWYVFKDIKPRVGRTVLVKFWGGFFVGKYTGYNWFLPLSKEHMRVDGEDEWTKIR
jgi:hypothetical protein